MPGLPTVVTITDTTAGSMPIPFWLVIATRILATLGNFQICENFQISTEFRTFGTSLDFHFLHCSWRPYNATWSYDVVSDILDSSHFGREVLVKVYSPSKMVHFYFI